MSLAPSPCPSQKCPFLSDKLYSHFRLKDPDSLSCEAIFSTCGTHHHHGTMVLQCISSAVAYAILTPISSARLVTQPHPTVLPSSHIPSKGSEPDAGVGVWNEVLSEGLSLLCSSHPSSGGTWSRRRKTSSCGHVRPQNTKSSEMYTFLRQNEKQPFTVSRGLSCSGSHLIFPIAP